MISLLSHQGGGRKGIEMNKKVSGNQILANVIAMDLTPAQVFKLIQVLSSASVNSQGVASNIQLKVITQSDYAGGSIAFIQTNNFGSVETPVAGQTVTFLDGE
jgi:hypothetical protein